MIAWVNEKYIKVIEMDIDLEESYCAEMPDLNLAGSAVQSYMFEPTKGTEGEKSVSGSDEDSDSDDELYISHGSEANKSLVSFQLFYYYYFSKQKPCSD